MTLDEFKQSLSQEYPPGGMPVQSKALWYDAKGEWKTAHDLIDQLKDPVSAHVHAYLHRVEGVYGMPGIGTIVPNNLNLSVLCKKSGHIW